jgi:hypothetical protein
MDKGCDIHIMQVIESISGYWEDDNNKKRRKITLHSRRYTKTTISDLDMLNSLNGSLVTQILYIGQKRIRIKERYFAKLNQNIPQLERQGADIQSKVEELE